MDVPSHYLNFFPLVTFLGEAALLERVGGRVLAFTGDLLGGVIGGRVNSFLAGLALDLVFCLVGLDPALIGRIFCVDSSSWSTLVDPFRSILAGTI